MKIATSSPARCAWIRAPSSFHSTYAASTRSRRRSRCRSRSARASARSGEAASAGNAARPSAPSRIAASATDGRSPASIAARRTSAAGRSAALATASVITPSSAPCRSSPRNRLVRSRCSGSVARTKSVSSSARRAACEPGPEIDWIREIAASTSSKIERRLRRRRRKILERRPAHADRSLRQLAGEVRDGDSNLVGRRAEKALGQTRYLREPRRRRSDVTRSLRDRGEQHRIPQVARKRSPRR